ncbi:MAG: pirin family protein [Deltaproteobacteria bacterium]|nr:pirin family protein [Deltaproteobacteria bacterium]
MKKIIGNLQPLGFHWRTQDPFLFCAHHHDHYPRGNELQGPDASLAGRHIGQDFTAKDGWRMYHGQQVPGFPEHPHRGFETVTIVLEGFVDHSDSFGGAGRYGEGDVQWMTAGSGMQHSEMFPCIHQDKTNPLHLFQVWLNLPAKDKLVAPHYTMLWAKDIPVRREMDAEGREVSIRIIAGGLHGDQAPAPAPNSWAAHPDNHVAIWIVKLAPHAIWNLPEASVEARRNIYYYQGSGLKAEDTEIPVNHSFEIASDKPICLTNGNGESHLLLLQGRPIGEPVAQHGPFVMNTREEIEQAIADYQRTQFGGWPWPTREPVHAIDADRFARFAGGRKE